MMEPRSLEFLSKAAGAPAPDGAADLWISRVCTDSRQLTPGDLFWALPGDRWDGHDFVGEAVTRGAAAVAIDKRQTARFEQAALPKLVLDGTRAALGRVAARYRRDFTPEMIAVAGSNGKTTTKELIAAVLSRRFQVLRSEASFNNDVGVPLTLLRLASSDEVAVLEVGTNHPGELEPLLQLVQPKRGVLTALGAEHLEFFKDWRGVAREEGALARALPSDGILVVHGDSPGLELALESCVASVVRVGFAHGNDWQLAVRRITGEGSEFSVVDGPIAYQGDYRIRLLGRHHVLNAGLAIAVGAGLRLEREEVQEGLQTCQPVAGRMVPIQTEQRLILDDSYNANADSMRAALETLQTIPVAGRRWAVLGEMAELGECSESAHFEVGRWAAELRLDGLISVGPAAAAIARAAREEGLGQAWPAPDVEAAAEWLLDRTGSGDAILVKASRVARLERVVERLMKPKCSTT